MPAPVPVAARSKSTRNTLAGQATGRLRILATTDLHMHVTGFDYYSDRPDLSVGLSRTAGLIRQARAEAEAKGATVLLLDNGDSFQGTPLGNHAIRQAETEHPLLRAFGLLGYDAIGFGNHDFEFGIDALQRLARQSPCPMVCSNLRILGQKDPWHRHLILKRSVSIGGDLTPVAIGIVSVLPPQTAMWNAHILQGRVKTREMLDAATRAVSDLRSDGADIIIALAHTGLGPSRAQPGLENALIPLAGIDGIDALVGGHTHLLFPGGDTHPDRHVDPERGLIHGKPVVMPGTAGSHLGVIDLGLARDQSGTWQVVSTRAELCPVARRNADGHVEPLVEEAPDILEAVAAPHAATRHDLSKPAGHCDVPLHSYFAFVAPDRSLSLVAEAQTKAMASLLKGSAHETLPLLSAVAPSKFGGRAGPDSYCDIPAGALSVRDAASLYTFENQLLGVLVTGAELRAWLEMSAGLFRTIQPGGSGAALIDPGWPGHNFDVIFGVRYSIDLSRPAFFNPDGSRTCASEGRVRDLKLGGRPVVDEQRFVVATNSYRANGGGSFTAAATAEKLPTPPIPVQDILLTHLKTAPPEDPLVRFPCPWRLREMPGTEAIAKTGPGAKRHLAELGDKAVDCGLDPDGFLTLRLKL